MKQDKDELNKILENAGLRESRFMDRYEVNQKQEKRQAIDAATRLSRYIAATDPTDSKYSSDGENYEFTMISDIATILTWINNIMVDTDIEEDRWQGYYQIERGQHDPYVDPTV